MKTREIFLKKFYIDGIFVFLSVSFILIFGIFLHFQKAEDNFENQIKTAENLIENHNRVLFENLKILRQNLEISSTQKPEILDIFLQNSHNLSSLFLIKNLKILSAKSNKISFLIELDIQKLENRLKFEEIFVSDFINHNKSYFYFIATKTQNNEILLAFINPNHIDKILNSINQNMKILNKNGKFVGGNSDIYEIFGANFNFEEPDTLQILKDKNGEVFYTFFSPLKNQSQFIYMQNALFSVVVANLQLFIFVFASIFLFFAFFTKSSKFLQNAVISPLTDVKKMLKSPSRSLEIYNQMPAYSEILGTLPRDIAKILANIKHDNSPQNLAKKFEQILKYSDICTLIIEPKNGKIIDASKKAFENYGENLKSKTIFQISNLELYDYSISQQNSYFTKDSYIFASHKISGENKQVLVQKFCVFGVNSVWIYMIFDVFKQHEILQSYKKQQKFMQTSPMVFAVFDLAKAEVIDITNNTKKLWGYEAKNFKNGKISLFSIINSQNLEILQKEISQNLQILKDDKVEFSQILKLKHSDNFEYVYKVKIAIFRAENRNLAIFYFQNINEISKQKISFENENKIYENIINSKLFVIWEYNSAKKELKFNANLLKILGFNEKYQKDKMSLNEFRNYIFEPDLSVFDENFNSYLKGKSESFNIEIRLKNAQNIETWINMQAKILKTSSGFYEVSGLMENITDKIINELDLRLVASVFSYSHEGMIILSKSGEILRQNDAFSQISGYENAKNAKNFAFFGDFGNFFSKIKENLENREFYSFELSCLSEFGRKFPALISVNVLKDESGEISHYLIMILEISHIKEKQEKLERIALFDNLTKLANRVYFMQEAKNYMIENAKNSTFMAILFIDFDGFKSINDTYGHEIGDIYLKKITHLMNQNMPKSDILARLGGDEFGAIISGLKSKNDVEITIKKLMQVASKKFLIQGKIINASVSIGVSFYNGGEEVEFKELLSRADSAMYQAKLEGKNRYNFFISEEENQLRKSIERGEFFVFFQPIADLINHGVFGYELLLRWKHPSMGLLKPGEFLFDIKNCELERILSFFVLEEMVKFQSKTSKFLSMNISVEQICDEKFYEFLKSLSVKNFSKFIFEITNLSSENFDIFNENVSKFKFLGIHFALNNANLENLVISGETLFDILKIDHEICLNIDDYENVKKISKILQFCKEWEIFCVVQSVESSKALRYLEGLGFYLAQGNYICEPIYEKDIEFFERNFSTQIREKSMSKDEVVDFTNIIKYRNLGTLFLNHTAFMQRENFDFAHFEPKFREILAVAENSKSRYANLNIEIHKQILGILTLENDEIFSYLDEFRTNFEHFLKQMENI